MSMKLMPREHGRRSIPADEEGRGLVLGLRKEGLATKRQLLRRLVFNIL